MSEADGGAVVSSWLSFGVPWVELSRTGVPFTLSPSGRSGQACRRAVRGSTGSPQTVSNFLGWIRASDPG